MNFEFFIAKRLITTKSYKSSVSAPIIKIGIIAVAISVIVMLFSISFSKGLENKIKSKVTSFNGEIIISNFDSNLSEGDQVPIKKNQTFVSDLKKIDGVSHIQATAQKFGVIRTKTNYEGLFVKGVGSDYNWKYFKQYLVEGKLPKYSQDYYNSDVLISEYLAKRLNLNVDDSFVMYFLKKSSKLQIPSKKFIVSGIFSSGFVDYDQTFILGDVKEIQRLNRWEKDDLVGQFEIFLENYKFKTSIAKQINSLTPPSLRVETIDQKYPIIFDWIDIFDKNTIVIISMMIMVGAINIITALLVLILERTQMIGILKSLGSTNFSIQKIFIFIATYLTFLGLFFGNIIGLGLLFIQKYFDLIKLDSSIYYVNVAPVHFSLYDIFILNIVTFALSILVLIIPSYLISKIDPIRALKFDS